MSFEALDTIDPRVARGALASTVLHLTGPGIDEMPEQFRKLSDAVLIEARDRLKLDLSDNSPEATEQIRILLAEEVSRQIYKGVDKDALTIQLGHEGKLSIGSYTLKGSRVFKEAFKRESLSFAMRCVKTADLAQHLISDIDRLNQNALNREFSLFVSSHVDGKSNPYFVLISAARDGVILNIDALWRIFPSVVDVTKASDPIDFYRAFAEHYGGEIELSGRPTGKRWLENEIVAEFDEIDVHNPSGRDYLVETMGRKLNGNAEIRYAAAIDIGMYRRDVLMNT